MEKFIIELKDYSKRNFLLELLSQFDFIELKTGREEKEDPKEEEGYDLFQSAGLFADRDIAHLNVFHIDRQIEELAIELMVKYSLSHNLTFPDIKEPAPSLMPAPFFRDFTLPLIAIY